MLTRSRSYVAGRELLLIGAVAVELLVFLFLHLDEDILGWVLFVISALTLGLLAGDLLSGRTGFFEARARNQRLYQGMCVLLLVVVLLVWYFFSHNILLFLIAIVPLALLIASF
jgi:hypothetical protein